VLGVYDWALIESGRINIRVKIEVCFPFPERQGALWPFYGIGEAFQLVEIDILFAG